MRRILTLFMLLTWLAVANVSAFTYEVISADDKTCAIIGVENPKALPSVFVIPDYANYKGEPYAVTKVICVFSNFLRCHHGLWQVYR